MKAKYQCCNCDSVFFASDAIDGYSEGFKEGFLCPICRANIKSDWLKQIPIKYRWIFSLTITLMVLVIIFRQNIESIIGINHNQVNLLVFAIGMLLLLFFNRNNLEDIFFLQYTKFIDKTNKFEKERTKQPWE